jgi:hypothetical protein
MSAYEIVSSLLLLATLVVLAIYTGKTATIARAAVEQGEVAQKPCMIVLPLPELPLEPGSPRENRLHLEFLQDDAPSVRFKNVGNGPALKAGYGIETRAEEIEGRPCPDMEVGREFDTGVRAIFSMNRHSSKSPMKA